MLIITNKKIAKVMNDILNPQVVGTSNTTFLNTPKEISVYLNKKLKSEGLKFNVKCTKTDSKLLISYESNGRNYLIDNIDISNINNYIDTIYNQIKKSFDYNAKRFYNRKFFRQNNKGNLTENLISGKKRNEEYSDEQFDLNNKFLQTRENNLRENLENQNIEIKNIDKIVDNWYNKILK